MPCPPSDEVRCRLAIVGTGLREGDMGQRVAQTLQECERLFCIEPLAAFARRHPALAHKCQSFDEVFDTLGHDRSAALRTIAARLIEVCASLSRAAFVLGGHPCLGVTPVQHLLALRPGWLAVETTPGVSSVDWLMADLGIDAADCGLQIVSGALCARLSPQLPAAIVSPGYAQSVALADRLAALARLTQDLMRCWGPEARFLVYSRGEAAWQLDQLAVADLVGLAMRPRLGETLLVGPLSLLPEHLQQAP